MAQEIPFSQVIRSLQDEQTPFPSRFLHRFSDLPRAELKTIIEVWPGLSQHRKHTLLEDLDTISDTDTLVSFEDLARFLLLDPDPGVRVRAISLLWECSDLKLLPVYFSILKEDKDIDARAAAASILGQYVYNGELDKLPAESLHAIEDILLDHTGEEMPDLVRRRALEALGASSRDEVPALVEKAYHRKEVDWIVSALYAMGRSNDETWEKYILARLLDQDEDIRSEAVRSAGKLGLAPARIALLDLLEDEEDTESRREILWSLSEIGGEGVKVKFEELLDTEEDDEQVDFLEEALENLLLTEDLNQFDLLDLDDTDLDGTDITASLGNP